MKKLIFISLVMFCSVTLLYGQAVTILPEHGNQIEIGDNTFRTKLNTRTNWSDFQIRTHGNYPISLSPNQVTGFRINPKGDVGIGTIAAQSWLGENHINNKTLARLHVYGGSANEKSWDFLSGWGYKAAVLGEVTKVPDSYGNYNYAGVMGVTDGKNSSSTGANVGVFAVATSNPASTGTTYSFKGENVTSSNLPAYGSYNQVSGKDNVYGNYAMVSSSGSSGYVYGAYNYVTNNSGRSRGVYNFLQNSEGEKAGVLSEVYVTDNTAYGVASLLRKYGTTAQFMGFIMT